MSEFGYKFKDQEIGIFYSRLSPKKLQKTDRLRGKQNTQIMNESIEEDYDKFIREYNPITDPFMHELRVHIFRRDTYLRKAIIASNLDNKKEFYSVAYKENLILEKYFSHSIEMSKYRWNEDTLHEIEVLADKRKPYESPVSADLFTSFSEKNVWIVILSIIFFIILFNLFFPHIEKVILKFP